MDPPSALLIAAFAWLVLAAAGWAVHAWLRRVAPDDDPTNGLLLIAARLLTRLVHRVEYTGVEHLPPRVDHGGLIVISNHTGAVDPLLIQARCGFLIRWMMAFEMMDPSLNFIWNRDFIIPVDRYRQDPQSLREALRHVKSGGVLGIFPEGRIVNPPCQVRPFYPGAGLIIAKCKVPVLLVWVSGTPVADDMLSSIITPSRARVRFIGVFDFSHLQDPKEIIRTLRNKIAEVSGWPMNDEELLPGGGQVDPATIPPKRSRHARRQAT